jgi:hypothetical protein
MFTEDQVALKAGYDGVLSEIVELAGEGNEDNVQQMGRAFETWVMRRWLPDHAESNGYEIIWPIGNPSQFSAIGERGGERQLDVGMILRKPGEENTADEYHALIGQCVRPEHPDNKPDSDKMREARSAITNLRLKTGNEARQDFMDKLEEVQIITNTGETHDEHGPIYEINEEKISGLFFCFGKLYQANQVGANSETRVNLERLGIKFVDGRDLSRWHYLDEDANAMMNTPAELTLNFQDLTEQIDGVRLGIITAGNLHEFFTDRRPNSPYENKRNHSLLYKNLRYQLPHTGTIGVDRDDIGGTMKTTLLDNPELFSQYNNGIVIVANSVTKLEPMPNYCPGCQELMGNGGNAVEDCTDCETVIPLRLAVPNIVNGGQTTNAIWEWIDEQYHETNGHHRAYNEATLVVKVIPCDSDEEITKIARYANRQNPIVPRDEYALDNDQEMYFNFFEQRGIVFDFKRGVRAPLQPRKEDFELTPDSKTWKEINNTRVAKRFLAAIGDPVSAFCIGEDLWKKDGVIKFVFSPNRTEELQAAAARERTDLSDLDLDSSRNGIVDFASDALLWELVYNFSKRVYNFREARRKWIINQPQWDKNSNNYIQWDLDTKFTSWWWAAVIRCFSMIIHHYSTGDNQGNLPDSVEYNLRREEIRQALIGNEYWENDNTKKRIFGTGQTWNQDIGRYFNNETTNRPIFEETEGGDFPLVAYWLKSIEAVILNIPVEQRSEQKKWKVFTIYETIETRIRAILGNPALLSEKFPEEYPANPDELNEQYETLVISFNRWHGAYQIAGANEDMINMAQGIKNNFDQLLNELSDGDEMVTLIGVYSGRLTGAIEGFVND